MNTEREPRASGRSPARRRRSFARALTLVAACGALGVAPAAAHAFVWPNVPEQIARALASSDPAERRLAAQKLPELPREAAIGLIRKSIGDPDVDVRLRLAQAAVRVRVPDAGDLVIEWLSDSDARLRLAACDVIRAAPTTRSVVALGRVLGDPDPHVRLAAASAMGASGLAEAVSPLLGHLDDPSPEVRTEVARALGRTADARAVVPLVGKVQDAVPEVRRAVARSLGELGDPRAASSLVLALQDGALDVRIEALDALGKLRSDEATLAIAPLVAEDDGTAIAAAGAIGRGATGSPLEVRSAALRALGHIGTNAAVRVLVRALRADDPSARKSPVRDALVSAGQGAVAPLVAALATSSDSATAAGAALVLGELRARDGLRPIVHGMQRGSVPLRFGLRALAALGAPEALPTVLELLGDPDPTVRMEAIAGAIALLDPAQIDGRAIDPATVALRDPATPERERVELVRLLGRTGAPRAQEVLLSLVTAKAPSLRLAVLESLGEIHAPSAKVDAALMTALDDEAADVRLAAAMALSRVASPGAAPKLLDRLMKAAEQDRGALGVALSGALARVKDDAVATKVREALEAAPDAARDALIEGLGRMPGKAAERALEALGASGIDDRRKVAEALAGHADAVALLRKLARDPDSGVRANAVWSLGHVGRRDDAKIAVALIADPDAAVAGNAAATLGRIAVRERDSTIATPLCAALGDARSYVRADALVGLAAAKASCPDPASPRALLARDPSDVVRVAAADYARVAAAQAPKPELAEPFRRALRRCASEDRDATVADRCASGPPEAGPALEDVGVFVVPDGRNVPLARSAFALVRTDGFLRLGLADRRGEIFERAVPRGTLRLAVPAPLAR